jgi:hypothetical protein
MGLMVATSDLLSCGQNPEIGRLPASELDHANNQSEDLSDDGRVSDKRLTSGS